MVGIGVNEMDNKSYPWWKSIRHQTRYWLAAAAMKLAGPASLYWVDPAAWEDYMRVGHDPRLVKAFEDALEAIRNHNGGDELADDLAWDSGLFDDSEAADD